jgi:thiol-activated cytolysin
MLRRLIPVAGALAVLGLACGDDVTDAEDETFEEVLAAAGRVEVLAPASHTITQDSTVDEGDYRVTYEKHDVVDNIESVVYLGLNDDIVWPGNLVKGDRAHDFVYEPIAVPRGPITLSLSLETATTGPAITRAVTDPRLSTVRQGISDLLRDAMTAGTTVPARVEFMYQQVFNESHLDLAVGADISYGGGSLDTRFDWNSTSKKTKIVAKYRQVYFTVDMDTPASLEAFFAPNTGVDVVAAAMPAGSRPIYVAGVSYGMMALMFIESDFTEEQMKAAINGAYSGVVDVKLSFGYTARRSWRTRPFRSSSTVAPRPDCRTWKRGMRASRT